MSKRDYYEALGIAKGASDDEIKKAFRKKAIELHPDKEGGDEAKFKEINEAYEVLKDSSKRQRYDQFGHAGVGGNGGGSGNPFSGFGNQGQEMHFDFGDMGGLGDIFGNFFGGGSQQGHQKQPERGHDVEMVLDLDFEEAIFGVETKVKLNLNDICAHCKGSTAEPGHEMKTCSTCKGSGQEVRVNKTIFGNIQQATVCHICKGKGKIPEKVCSVCKGTGVQRKNREVNIKIPAGIYDGATIRLREYGEATSNGNKGDLYVHIRVKPHKEFTREGNLILSSMTINMVDATLGTEVDVNTVDGPVKMKIPAGTQAGTDFKLSGHGVPNIKSSNRGPHIVTINLETPTKLSKDQKNLLEQFRASSKKGWFK